MNNIFNQNTKIEIFQSSVLADLIVEIKKLISGSLKIDIKTLEAAPIHKIEMGDFSIPLHKFDIQSDVINLAISKLSNQFMGKGIKEIKLEGKYLNFFFDEKIIQKVIEYILNNDQFSSLETLKGKKIMVEYSSPNTNKPLHLGHIRNNVLGMAITNILEKNGAEVVKTSLINDRGIHICKSMWAYQKFGNNKTPQSEGIKGDLFVGNFYVMFEQEYNQEKQEYIKSHNINLNSLNKIELEKFEKEFVKQSKIYSQAQKLLIKWENNDKETIELWEKMNQWVYQGFAETYQKLGSQFDINYYESETYLKGKKMVFDYLAQGLIEKKDDNAIGIKLDDGSFKVLIRSDGTSVYMTQDIGTAIMRSKEYSLDNTIYIVGNEQDYHFKILFQILKKLNFEYTNSLYHLSYGMIELPEGKMKSREGNAVDADGLISELTNMAKEKVIDNNDKTPEDIAMAAIKYYILKSNAKTKLIFDPKKSLDFEGLTGPYLQYTCARINSIINKVNAPNEKTNYALLKEPVEKEIINLLARYPEKIKESALQLDPSILANYLGDLAIKFNQWYHNFSVINSENKLKKARLEFIKAIHKILVDGLTVIGIKPLNKM